MASVTFYMALICISFEHVTILDIWLILNGFKNTNDANYQHNKDKS